MAWADDLAEFGEEGSVHGRGKHTTVRGRRGVSLPLSGQSPGHKEFSRHKSLDEGFAVSVVQNKCQQRLVDLDSTVVVFDEAQFSEFVHEEIDARARSADDFRHRLLGNSGQLVV